MGVFGRKAPKTVECDGCGLIYAPGEGRPHVDTHIVRIGQDEPSWLPEYLRAQAQGEYMFLCGRCNCFPTMKWPSQGGAYGGLMSHLAVVHHVGLLRDQANTVSVRGSIKFEMIQAE
jgi:hypothetical protein